MLPRIIISIDKPGAPPGMVLLEDAGSQSSGLHDSLARLIQRQLGFPWRANLRQEAKRLTRIALTGVSKVSGLTLDGYAFAALGDHWRNGVTEFASVDNIPDEIADTEALNRRALARSAIWEVALGGAPSS